MYLKKIIIGSIIGLPLFGVTTNAASLDTINTINNNTSNIKESNTDYETKNTFKEESIKKSKYKKINGYVTSNQLNLRSDATALSQKKAVIQKGQKVEILDENNGWIKVKAGKQEGYVSGKYIKESSIDIKRTNNNSTDIIQQEEIQTKPDNTITKPQNTNYDNYHPTNNKKLEDFVEKESKNLNTVYNNGKWEKATKEQIKNTIDPNSEINKNHKTQFARIDSYRNDISEKDLNRYLNNYTKSNNIFHNQASAFINAAKKANINVLYFVAHSMVETGHGTSRLANGLDYNGETVYNFFGIGAVDNNPIGGGTSTAYRNGWTTIQKGLDGAAQWISDNYIHSTRNQQNTLYKMRWNKNNTYHQYASDISWARLIGDKMDTIRKYTNKIISYKYDQPIF